LIVRAASIANCAVFYSEDLSAGQVIDGAQIVNPF
jgi:predicted nucleic acid-binding protein